MQQSFHYARVVPSDLIPKVVATYASICDNVAAQFKVNKHLFILKLCYN